MARNSLVIIGLLIIISVITGCGNKEITGDSVVNITTCNSPYFEYKTGECCLDKDNNRICDSDEEPKEEVTAPVKEKEEPKTLTTQPVQALTVEACTDSSYFDCTWSYITREEVQFKLRASRSGSFVLKKISLPNVPCEKEFEEVERDDGIKYDDVIEVNVKCDFKKDSVESDLMIKGIFHQWLPKEEDVMNIGGYRDPISVTAKSWISGMVR